LRVLRVYHSAVVTEWRERDRQLRALGADVTLISAQQWNEGGQSVAFAAHEDGFAHPARTWGRHPYRFAYDPRPLVRAMRSGRFDVIDVHEEPASIAALECRMLARLLQPRVPIVFYGAQNIEKRFPPPFRWIERASLRRAAGAHCCNREAAEIFVRKGLRGQTVTLGLGVDLEQFSPPAEKRPPGPFRLGYVGRLEPHKGVHLLVEALASLPGIELWVFGDGSCRPELQAQVATLGLESRVRFAGFVSGAALASAYRSVDAIAVPSQRTLRWVEQFGRVAVEAMASGTPVLVSDNGSLPDVVGDAGVLVDAAGVDAWRKAIDALVDDADLRADLARRGLVQACRYSWSEIAEQQLAFYRSVAS
jgi:glycosyltransferase involved in cell wall biosynthesis